MSNRSVPFRTLIVSMVVAVGLGLTVLAGPAVDRSLGSGEIELVSAGGCTLRSGPAQFQQNCIQVDGDGLFVRTIESYVQAASVPGWPGTVCTISVEMTGTLADGSPYFASGTTEPGCSLISRGMTATVNRDFLPQSQICTRTLWGTHGWSTPACVQVRYDW